MQIRGDYCTYLKISTHFLFMGLWDTEKLSVYVRSTLFNQKSPLAPAFVSTLQGTFSFVSRSILFPVDRSAFLKPVSSLSFRCSSLAFHGCPHPWFSPYFASCSFPSILMAPPSCDLEIVELSGLSPGPLPSPFSPVRLHGF